MLFGSHAYGIPTEHSDVDLLVVMPFQERERALVRRIKQSVGLDKADFTVDVLVYDPEVLRQRLEWEDWFLREITEKGIVLYEAAHAGVG